MGSKGFWRELKRRHVYRVAAAYAIVGWLLIQVVTQVFPIFHLPDWVDQAIVLLILVGFPIALVLAWAFDATPHGIVRTDVSPAGGDPGTPTRRRSRRAGIAVGSIGVLIAIVAGAVWWHAARSRTSASRDAHMASAKPVAATPAASVPATINGSAATPQVIPAASLATQPIPAKSIAVLPFENLSGDPKQAYFSDGITEEILNALAQIPDLKVTARNSAFTFSSGNEDPRKIGETLGVANLLEGSVQKSGGEVRINVQLIDARTGYQRWSEKYDRKLTNIFTIEDEISNAIAGKLRVQLSGSAGQALVAQKAIDPRAHDFYLRGLTLLAVRSMREAVDAFQQAVKLDPGYAQAWGALAVAEVLLPAYGLDSVAAALPRAQSAAQRSLALDPDAASAYVALGVAHSLRWQWAEADQAFRRALTLVPNDAEAVDQYAQFLYVAGQLQPALGEIERAQRLDPLSAVIGANRASILGALHRYDAAAVQIESTLTAHPNFAVAHSIAVVLAVNRHRYAEAEAQIRLANKLNDNDPNAKALLVRGMADPAQRAAAVKSLETSRAHAGLRRDPIVYALFLIQLGEHDRALDALEGNVVSRSSDQAQLLWNPAFDPIRSDPRFKAVLKKMGLPYTAAEAAAP